jgi:hypothetical protein
MGQIVGLALPLIAFVLGAIREDELYVFTHSGPDWCAELKKRFDAVSAAMDKAAARSSTSSGEPDLGRGGVNFLLGDACISLRKDMAGRL